MNSNIRHAFLALGCGLLAPWAADAVAASTAGAADPLAQTVVYDNCSWNHPGVDPFMGDVVAAVDRYRDIPPDVRARLKERMEKRDYDDLVSIRRDSIDGRGGYDYGKTITDMHFGTHQLCRSVTRTAWSPQMQERGLVYCESGQCILVPTVCRNVSRITRAGVGPEAVALPPLLGAAPPVDGYPPIDFVGPPGAGMPAGGDALADGVPAPVPPLDGMVGGYPFGGYPFGVTGIGPLLGAGFAGGVVAGALIDGDAANAGPAAGSGSGPVPVGGGSFIPPGGPVIVAGGGGVGAVGGAVGGGGGGGRPIAPVPEPSTWALLLLGVAGTALATRRRGLVRPRARA